MRADSLPRQVFIHNYLIRRAGKQAFRDQPFFLRLNPPGQRSEMCTGGDGPRLVIIPVTEMLNPVFEVRVPCAGVQMTDQYRFLFRGNK